MARNLPQGAAKQRNNTVDRGITDDPAFPAAFNQVLARKNLIKRIAERNQHLHDLRFECRFTVWSGDQPPRRDDGDRPELKVPAMGEVDPARVTRSVLFAPEQVYDRVVAHAPALPGS